MTKLNKRDPEYWQKKKAAIAAGKPLHFSGFNVVDTNTLAGIEFLVKYYWYSEQRRLSKPNIVAIAVSALVDTAKAQNPEFDPSYKAPNAAQPTLDEAIAALRALPDEH